MSFSTQRFKSGWFWSWFIRHKELTSANWLSSRDFCFSISVSWSRTKSSRRHMAQARSHPPYLPQMPKSEEKLFFIRLMVWYRSHPSWLMVSKCARQNQQNARVSPKFMGSNAEQHLNTRGPPHPALPWPVPPIAPRFPTSPIALPSVIFLHVPTRIK